MFTHISRLHVVKRCEFYIVMIAIIALVALLGEVAKHFEQIHASLGELIRYVWHAIAHFISDVSAAEVGSFLLKRIFDD